jgi:hypothetical protein
MNKLKTDAEVLKVGFIVGVYEVADVIKWADKEIERLDKPPLALIDLAMMSKAHRDEIKNQLAILSNDSDPLTAIREVLGKLYFTLLDNPTFAPKPAKGLYNLAEKFDFKLPEDIQSMSDFDYSFDLVRGDDYHIRRVTQEFLDFLKPFAEINSESSLP